MPRLSYAYNNANQRIVQQESDNTVTAWTYDKKYQLTNELRYIMGSGRADTCRRACCGYYARTRIERGRYNDQPSRRPLPDVLSEGNWKSPSAWIETLGKLPG
ncbi:MAG TPA: hypothetical protein VFE47_11625 [Tepidisphaeraceae bacterium]|nr:hypothetical protein [Tepidisphaeraceae bacterium]